MLIQEQLTIINKDFVHTWSSIGNFIANEDGTWYGEAFDPAPTPHAYVETDVNIEEWEREQEETQGEPE